MDSHNINYPYLPIKIKPFIFRGLNPVKQLESLSVGTATTHGRKKSYPVISENGKPVNGRFILFSPGDYCYFTGKNRGIIVTSAGDWFKGKFTPEKKPVNGIGCQKGNLIFYFFHLPFFNTGKSLVYLLTFAILGAALWFGIPYLNLRSSRKFYSAAIETIQTKIVGKKEVNAPAIDYSRLDPENPADNWRPRTPPQVPILAKILQEGVDSYIQGKTALREKKYQEAYNLFSNASTSGFVPGDYYVALLFLNGSPDKVIAENKDNARFFFLQAAKAGHAPSQYQLAQCHASGFGTVRHPALAKYWAYKSAMAGYAPGQRMLGKILLESGQRENALQWLHCAALQGDKQAKKLLAQPRFPNYYGNERGGRNNE